MIAQYFLWPLSPVLCLMVTGLLVIFLEALAVGDRFRTLKSLLGIVGPLASIVCSWLLYRSLVAGWSTGLITDQIWLQEFVRVYHLDTFVMGLYWAIGFFTLLGIVFTETHLREFENRSEVLALMLWIASGMMLLVSAGSLLMVFVALELMSLPTYVLVGMRRSDARSSEAALKYFLFGSFGTVLLVLAAALFYAQFATLNIDQIAGLLKAVTKGGIASSAYCLAGFALLVASVGFKIGLAPFHMWVPDTYQGAPTPITGFMGSAVKLAGFGLCVRLFWDMLGPMVLQWAWLLGWMAVVTMFVGNLAALTQSNLKRMLAYSSVAHAGYLFLGIASLSKTAVNYQPIQYYLMIYGLMFLGMFGVLSWVEENTGNTDVQSLNGLGFKRPWIGACVAIFALSAAGIPPTAGFFAKYFLFLEAVKNGGIVFVTLAVISSLIGVYYYLRILVHLYMKDPVEKEFTKPFHPAAFAGVLACALSLLYFVISA